MKIRGPLRVIPVVVVMLLSPLRGSAQPDTTFVPSDIPPAEGNLNAVIDATLTAGKLSNTVFMLEPNGRYVLTGTITVPAGQRLTIVAPEPGNTQATAPPRILWTSKDGVTRDLIFDCYGNITLKHIWLLYARTDGWQSWSSVMIEDSPDSINGQHGDFEGVIFDYAGISAEGSGCVGVKARHFRGVFRNCYFRNCTDPHFRYYGRAVSFPFASTGWHIDSLRFDNCTFANIGYVYMQEGGEYGDHIWFNHCTFLNVVMYTLESGWWHWLNVSNSVFVNTYMWGDAPGWRWPDTTDAIGATVSIDSIASFGFAVPFTESGRHILFTHSSYATEAWLRDYMTSGYDGKLDSSWVEKRWWPVPQPMMSRKTKSFFLDKATWPFVSMGPLYDSTDPGFTLAPTNRIGIKTFLYFKISGGQDTAWAYNPQDNIDGVWPMKEDLSYTNPNLLTAGMGGFPLGDLYHWYPGRYAQWQAQEHAEGDRIRMWLATGHDPGGLDGVEDLTGDPVPGHFELSQNYPNPFNPTTTILFTLPARSFVLLKIFDILGREVSTLVSGQLPAGTHSRQWDGAGMSSGVYYYRLQAGPSVATRKLLFLR